MIIIEFSIIIVASKRLRVGWGQKKKGPTMMIALELMSWQLYNTTIIMAESNILGIITHTVLFCTILSTMYVYIETLALIDYLYFLIFQKIENLPHAI